MKEHATIRSTAVPALLLALLSAACGGAVASGVAVGKIGHDLSGYSRAVPQGAEVCALQDALNAAPGVDKPSSEICTKAANKDLLWRKAMVALAAYANTLESVAAGGSGDTAGQLEGALVGVRGNDWVDVEGSDAAARDAVGQIVTQLANNNEKGDLGARIKNAAGPVKTLCEGLVPYLETTTKAFGDLQKEIDKKRTQRADRRCGQAGGTNVCVGESVLDRMTYADAYGQLSVMEINHAEAHDDAAAFCAAHKKLEAAAADGNLSKDQTYLDVVATVKAVPRTHTGGESKGGESKGAAKPPAPPPPKK
jgi:hypothetical protein